MFGILLTVALGGIQLSASTSTHTDAQHSTTNTNTTLPAPTKPCVLLLRTPLAHPTTKSGRQHCQHRGGKSSGSGGRGGPKSLPPDFVDAPTSSHDDPPLHFVGEYLLTRLRKKTTEQASTGAQNPSTSPCEGQKCQIPTPTHEPPARRFASGRRSSRSNAHSSNQDSSAAMPPRRLFSRRSER